MMSATGGIPGVVFGDWNEAVVNMTKAAGANFKFLTPAAGFIKETGEGIDGPGPPVIVTSKRWIPDGGLATLAEKVNAIAAYHQKHVPGVLALTFAPDIEPNMDPNMVWDLQVFANMEAFYMHQDLSNPELAMLLNSWVMSYGPEMPLRPFEGTTHSGDPRAVKALTDSMGAHFVNLKIPLDVGFVSFTNGDPPMAGVTCGDMKSKYKEQGCCGNPTQTWMDN